jgi:hypothetical protein
MQDVFQSVQQKTILTEEGSRNMVPYLPLNQLSGKKRATSGGAGQKEGSGGK